MHGQIMVLRQRLVCMALWALAGAISASEFFVTPSGSSAGDGSTNRPWNLQTALFHPASVRPGDTIWLRQGIYGLSDRPAKFVSYLAGASNQPITVRQYPGERATVDCAITQVQGGWVNYWGFEIMNSMTNRYTSESGSFPTNFSTYDTGKRVDYCVSGFSIRAPQIKLINLVVHDCIGGGVGFGTNGVSPEIYGVLSYYNGWQGGDRGHGHGLYAQSADPGSPRIEECLFFANYAIGIHAYGTVPVVDNFYFEGNAAFFNGVLALRHQANLVLGPESGLAKNPVLIRNFIYDNKGTSSDANIGYNGGALNPILRSNYFQTSVLFCQSNQNLVMTGNIFLSNTLNLAQSSYPANTYLTAFPSNNLVEIRTNKYEPGRAHIIIYNWENLSAVSVDLTNILPAGDPFEIRNAQDFYGPPVLAGRYRGDPLTLPLINLNVAKPVGANAPASTAPRFNVFVLLSTNSLGPGTGLSNTASPVRFDANGTALLHLSRLTNSTYQIQASTNLTSWATLGAALTDTNGLLEFPDPTAPQYPTRFYRTIADP